MPHLPPSSSMNQLIPIINKLHDVFSAIDHNPIDLPQIVVVGSQSSGKSSVLENIVQRDFLPRGKDIVTRRPLVLQLIQTKPPASKASAAAASTTNSKHKVAAPAGDEWGEFLHLPGEKFFSFDAIRDEISANTEKVAGENKGIARLPIHLKVFSPHLLNLTLVDLPGITKIPVGDQPPDIEVQTKQLIYEYISKPNSIILAVTPANIDLVNSEALKISREVDPEGNRTIGVLTKLDLMDAGTNALDILAGRSPYRLRLGFVGCVNRSQQDIHNCKPVADALRHEADYFRNHAAYRAVADRCGTQHLAKTLNALLMQHIREQLPELRMKLNLLMGQKQAALSAYGDGHFGTVLERGTALLRFLTRFATDFCECIDGTSRSTAISDMYGGARINFIFNEVFSQALASGSNEAASLSLADVKSAIRTSTGTRPSLFVPEVSFELLVKKQIAKIELPGIRCVELVLEELLKIIVRCDRPELKRFPVLVARIVDVATALVKERLEPTLKMVLDLIAIETAYINTNHPDFMRAGAAISALGKIYERRKKDSARLASAAAPSRSACEKGGGGVSCAADDSFGVLRKHDDSQPLSAAPRKPDRFPSFTSSENGILAYIFRSSASSSAGSPVGAKAAASIAADSQQSSAASAFHRQQSVLGSGENARLFSPVRHMAPPKNDIFDDEELLIASMTQLDPSCAAVSSLQSAASAPGGTSFGMGGCENALHESFYRTSAVEFVSEKEEMEVHLIFALVQSYCAVVKKNLQDTIPKAIMHFMVNNVKESLQNRLVSSMYREELFEELLQEDHKIIVERESCRATLDLYKKAASILTEIKELYWSGTGGHSLSFTA